MKGCGCTPLCTFIVACQGQGAGAKHVPPGTACPLALPSLTAPTLPCMTLNTAGPLHPALPPKAALTCMGLRSNVTRVDGISSDRKVWECAVYSYAS